jgi:hypothetical protein
VTGVELPEALRRLLACPDCDSELEAFKVGVVLRLIVRHDDTCPMLARIEARS